MDVIFVDLNSKGEDSIYFAFKAAVFSVSNCHIADTPIDSPERSFFVPVPFTHDHLTVSDRFTWGPHPCYLYLLRKQFSFKEETPWSLKMQWLVNVCPMLLNWWFCWQQLLFLSKKELWTCRCNSLVTCLSYYLVTHVPCPKFQSSEALWEACKHKIKPKLFNVKISQGEMLKILDLNANPQSLYLMICHVQGFPVPTSK